VKLSPVLDSKVPFITRLPNGEADGLGLEDTLLDGELEGEVDAEDDGEVEGEADAEDDSDEEAEEDGELEADELSLTSPRVAYVLYR
jgi:hypothetical protein